MVRTLLAASLAALAAGVDVSTMAGPAAQAPPPEEPPSRARRTRVKGPSLDGIAIGTYQAAEAGPVGNGDPRDEPNAQLLLEANLPLGLGHWHAEARAGTTPRGGGVTETFPEANAAIGETLDSNGNGRVAVTQLYYDFDFGRRSLSVGLIDPTYFLDANDLANNEYSQFLGTSFVNNPTVDFPSFSLAATYNARPLHHLQYRFYISSSSGLEEPNDPTYGNVFSPAEPGDGVFAAAETQLVETGVEGHLGVWVNTRDAPVLDPALDAPSDTADNYGAYANLIGSLAAGEWDLRVGIARESVSPAANFIGLTASYPVGRALFAVGASRTGASDGLAAPREAFVQAEAYLRVHLFDGLYITPDVQYLDNSGFEPEADGWIGSVRLGFEF